MYIFYKVAYRISFEQSLEKLPLTIYLLVNMNMSTIKCHNIKNTLNLIFENTVTQPRKMLNLEVSSE